MKKLWEKDEVTFAVLWIVVYVAGFGTADSLSEAVGLPKVFTVLLGLVLSGVLYGFVCKHQLADYYGLKPFVGSGRRMLYFMPLILLSCVNLWGGVTLTVPAGEAALYVISMICVAFLEEVIFRGLLFRGMCRSGVKAAVIVSSLTFGVGHIVNLLLGAPLLDTLLQLVYASAIGFCYTAVVYTGGSLIPCILSHAVVNSTSVLTVEPSGSGQVLLAAVQTVLSGGYGLWLWRHRHQIME